MEKYRDTLKRRIRLGAAYCALLSLPNLLLNRYLGGELFTGFIMGFMYSFAILVIVRITIYVSALKNESALKKLYIKEHDERTQMIRTKSGITAISIILAGLILAMTISSFFNKTIFFTLLAVEVFIVLVGLSLKLYYLKKI